MDSANEAAVVGVGAVVFDRAGRVLLVKRAHAPGAGSWSLPGGRVEAGESAGAAVVREVREETGLAVVVRASLGDVRIEREGYRYLIHEFLCAVSGPEAIAAGDDAAEAHWATPDDLTELAVSADAVTVIERGRTQASAR